MDHEERNMRNKGYTNFRGSMHIGMGGIYVALGCTIIYLKHFGAMELSPWASYIGGSIALLYGGFRIWRGWQYMRHRSR